MAIKVGGTTVIDNSRELQNIATVDSATVSTLNSALNVDPTKGTLTKTFTQNETADITLSSNITSGCPVVSATKEVPQTGVSTKGNWDVNSTASNYDFHNTAANVTLTPSTVPVANVSLATYANKASGSLGFTGLRGVWFKPDGTKMFTMDRPNAQIIQQNLSTAWDVSTQSNSGSYFTFTSGITTSNQPYGLWFNSDGTKLFVNNLSRIVAFTLSTAWDLSTISIVSNGDLSTSSYDNTTRGTFFKADGSRVYVVGTQTNTVYEYEIPTAWDLTSVVNAAPSRQFAVSSQANSARDVYFTSTGTTFYIVNDDGNIYEYSLSTAWDVSTASYTNNSFNTSSQGSGAQAMFLGNGNMYVVNDANNQAYQYNFSSDGLVLGSGSFASTDVGKRIVGNGGDVILTSTGGAYSTTGGSAFTDNSTIAAGSWQMFGLKSAGDADGITLSGFSQTGTSFNTNAPLIGTSHSHITLSSYVGFCVSQNGLHAYGARQSNGQIHHFTMSTAFDVTTLSLESDVLSSGYSFSSGDTHISSDGTKVYATNNNYPYSGDFIRQFDLSTAWDLSTANSGTEVSLNGGGQAASTANGHGGQMDFSPDGTKLYLMPYAHWTGNSTHGDSHPTNSASSYSNSGVVWQYTLSTAYDITGTKTYDGAVRVPMKGNSYASMCVTSDGKYLISTQYNGSDIFIYPLTTPFDITTATHTTEEYFNTSAHNSSGSNSQGGITNCHVNGKLFNYYYGGSRVDVNAYGTGLDQVIPTQQYHVGVTNSGGRIDSQYFTDINSMTAAESAGTGTAHYAVSTDGRTTWSVAKGTDGVRPIVRNNSGTWQYNNESSTTTSGPDLSIAAYDSKSFNSGRHINGLAISSDGTRIYYVADGHYINQRTLSTAFDISTAGSETYFDQDSQDNDPRSVTFKPDGTKMYVIGTQNYKVYQYSLSTAWDVTTASFDSKEQSISGKSIQFKSDGTKLYVTTWTNPATIAEYTLSTAWDISTASATGSSLNVSSQETGPWGIYLKPDGTQLYVTGENSDLVSLYNLSTAFDLSTASYGNTLFSVSSQSTQPKGLVFSSDGTKMYIGNGNASSGYIYQYSTGATVTAYVTTPTWANGSTNDEIYTLQQALSVAANRMDKTQLDAVADANHFPTGTSLDLMIALRMDTAASTIPTSDGVTLNYDAAALNEGAVLGTDYDFFFPANNKVQIKSLAAQNLKVRVV